VEVQIFGDSHGNCVYLWERDCSVQRRHQKVIEEAPALGLTAETRRRIGSAAVNAAKAVKYTGAGTVEFIVENQDFYFMEMNTRLQVEHPVTEAITGQDLVQWQLLVAMGYELPIKNQNEIPGPFGHALEMSVYAEEVGAGFVPAPGHIHAMRVPGGDARVESAIVEGDTVSVHYDPMIAKLVIWGENRTEAIRKADLALSQFNVGGVETNIDFMRKILQSNAFRNTIVTTKFIEENHDELLTPKELSQEQLAIATLALSAIHDYDKSETLARRFRMNSDLKTQFTVKDGEKKFDVGVVFSKRNGGNKGGDYTVGDLKNCQLLSVDKVGEMFEMEVLVGTRKQTISAALGGENILSVFTAVSITNISFGF
jgi:3-methylcrotonyl-CoA carboxylase alpha subunit